MMMAYLRQRFSNSTRSTSGLVLILALWTLSLLTVFAVNVGLSVRQKIKLLERLERRQNLQMLAESGVRKFIATQHLVQKNFSAETDVFAKQKYFNNPDDFKDIPLGAGIFSVCRDCQQGVMADMSKKYGVVGEASKININHADRTVLKRLVETLVGLEEESAKKLADAIVDWREYGETEIEGFFSNEYYENLEYPYPPKKAPFEILEELLLVKGMTSDIFRRIQDRVTIYGSGQININEADSKILSILGMAKDIADKIVTLRKGPDKVEATMDDFFFKGAEDLLSSLGQSGQLADEEMKYLRDFLATGVLIFHSTFYTIHSQARLNYSPETKDVVAVIESNSGRIVYWNE
jgi:type II secretory pathway component PulK